MNDFIMTIFGNVLVAGTYRYILSIVTLSLICCKTMRTNNPLVYLVAFSCMVNTWQIKPARILAQGT